VARGYSRLTPVVVDALWARLRAGQGAKPTARELGVVDEHGSQLSDPVRRGRPGSAAPCDGSVEFG